MTNETTPFNGPSSDWLTIAQAAFSDGRTFFESGVRAEIEGNIRQFQGQHPVGSKYLSPAYQSKSRFFRPKTRGVVRKNEAIAAQALFSNEDVVEISAWDDDDEIQVQSAKLNKELLNLRLKRSVPWFLLAMGSYQEAQVNGLVCSYQSWKYDKKKKVDRPDCELVPIENIVFSPSAKWFDVVNTSPYFIHMIPMYVKDVRAKMRETDETGATKWMNVSDADLLVSVKSYSDGISLVRQQGRPDPQAQSSTLRPYQIVWVHRNIAEVDGTDYIWYTLGDAQLLTKGVPLSKEHWHGLRPYVVGYCVVEAHKTYPPGNVRLGRDIQGELNENANQRIDNVKFAMNKRYFGKRGAQIDLRALSRNIPGGTTLMNDVEKDVKVVETKDVTASAYQEQDRLNMDFDEISGSWSKQSAGDRDNLANKVGGAEMLTEDANQIQGYQLRTWVNTWVEPVLYQLMRLEQHYETDEGILKLCGKKANLNEKGDATIDDNMLMQDLGLIVHVGIGATSPKKQLDNFLAAFRSIVETLKDGTLDKYGLDIEAFANEIFSKLGYKSGNRFFKWDNQDPQVVSLNNQVSQLQQALANKKDPPEIIAAKVELLKAQVKKTLADAFNVNVEGLFGSMQAGEVAAAVPAVAPVADTIAKAAGYQAPNPAGVNPVLEGNAGPVPVGAPPAAAAAPAPAPIVGPAAAGAPGGLSLDPKGIRDQLHSRNTGVILQPGGAPPAQLGQEPVGRIPGIPQNTDPLHPAKPAQPASSAVGTHHGIHTMRPEG